MVCIIRIVPILSAIALVVFCAVLVKRFRQFIQWKFYVSIVFGFPAGLVNLLVHAFENVRKTVAWEVMEEGYIATNGFLRWLFMKRFLTESLPPFRPPLTLSLYDLRRLKVRKPCMLLLQGIESMSLHSMSWKFLGFLESISR